MPPYEWQLRVSAKAQKQVDELPSEAKMAVFSCLKDLLEANNPLIVHGVARVQEQKDVWRRRAGNYRILFAIDSDALATREN